MKQIFVAGLFWFLFLLTSCGLQKEEIVNTNDSMMKDAWVMEKTESNMMEQDTMMKKSDEAMMDTSQEAVIDQNSTMEKPEDSMMKKSDEAMMDTTEGTMMKKGNYTAYSADMIGKSENTVVFFHANWCPSCRAADTGISAGNIPENLTILKADYDSETELKKKYGVTSQHTFVLLNSQGEMMKKWVGGTKVEDIVEKL